MATEALEGRLAGGAQRGTDDRPGITRSTSSSHCFAQLTFRIINVGERCADGAKALCVARWMG